MSSLGTKATENVAAQYSNAGNLNARIELHRRFSSNKYGWTQWVFDQLDLDERKNILELGCGNGDLWRVNLQRIPANIDITLSDFSSGMLDIAEQKLKDALKEFQFKIIDAQSIPYENESFDIIIANHMMYHLPDRRKAISEIYRVLRSDGTVYATTIGSEHMKELTEIVCEFDPRIDYSPNSVANDFGLESGIEQLKEYFSDIKVLRYEDSLDVTEATLLVEYVLSSQGFGNVTEIIKDDRKDDFKKYISSLIEKNGSIRIKKDSGILIASK